MKPRFPCDREVFWLQLWHWWACTRLRHAVGTSGTCHAPGGYGREGTDLKVSKSRWGREGGEFQLAKVHQRPV